MYLFVQVCNVKVAIEVALILIPGLKERSVNLEHNISVKAPAGSFHVGIGMNLPSLLI